MICPNCGSDTPAPAGHCTVCHTRVSAEVATAALTPIPPGTTDQVTQLPPPSETPTASPTRTPAPSPETGEVTELPEAIRQAKATGALTTGQSFGSRYHIIKLLGVGGMGAVYQAWDDELGVAVALKVIRLDVDTDPLAAEALQRRFKRELLLARQVTHKNVVRIHDLGEVEGVKYITMPFVQGSDLASVLRKVGRLSVARTLPIARQVAAGLAAAHEAGVVHRDLKPANIMIDEDGNALIMDFGIARSVGGKGGTVAGAVVGTLDYMAPEQARGEEVDQRADIYAFGLILYDMLVGRRSASVAQSAIAELMARMQQAPAPLHSVDPTIPEPLEHIVSRCLEPFAANRYQTIKEVGAEFDRLNNDGHLAAGGTTATTTPFVPLPSPQPAPPPRPVPMVALPRKWLGVGLAAIVLIGGAIAVVSLRGRLPGRIGGRQTATTESVSLAVLPFRNASGDPSLDKLGLTLAEMLRSEVGQSSQLRTIPADRLHRVLSDLRIAADSNLDPAALKRLAEFSGADTMLWGQFLKFGNEIRIDATLEDVKRQRSIPLKAEAASLNGLFGAADQLAQAIRDNLALSSDVLAELKKTAFKPSTRSMEALADYNEGLQRVREGKQSDAQKSFEAALKQDPDFALAYARLGQTYAALGYDNEAEQQSRRASELSQGLPLQERYRIAAMHARITNNLDKAIESYESLLKVSPEDPEINFELAGFYELQGSFDKAAQHFGKVVQQDPKFISALLAVGRVEIRRGNPQAAIEPLNKALTLSIQLENDVQRADILHAIGVGYTRLQKQNDALRYFQESLDIKRRLGQKRAIAVTVGEIAKVEQQLGKTEQALASYKEALQLQHEIGDKRGTATTLINLGRFYEDRGNYDRALQHYKDSLQLQREIGNRDGEALGLNNIGNIYLFKAQYDDAQTYFERALQIREKAKNPKDIADVLHNLAETATNKGQYEQALGDYLRALGLRRDAGDKRGAAIESYSMGTVFEYQGRFGAAVNAKDEALKAFRALDDHGFWMGEILSGYGNALSQIGKWDEAQESLDEASTLVTELKNKALAAQILNFQGDRLFYRGDLKAARASFEQAVPLAAQTTDARLLLLSKLNLAKVDVKEGRSQAAINALKGLADQFDVKGLKNLAVQTSVYLGEALLDTKNMAQARQELDRALGKAEKLGVQATLAQAHHLLARAARATGSEAEATRHVNEARRIVGEIRKEAGTDQVVTRSDLSPILAH